MVSVSAWAGVEPEATVARSRTESGITTSTTPVSYTHLPEFIADPQPEAVQGTDVESWAAVDVRAALPHFSGCLVVVGQGGDGARVHAAFGDEVPETLCEHPGLARTCRGDHPGRPGAVVDCGELVGSQIGGRVNPAGRSKLSRLRVPPVDHPDPRRELRRLRWAAIDEDRGPVGQNDVSRRNVSRRNVNRRHVSQWGFTRSGPGLTNTCCLLYTSRCV